MNIETQQNACGIYHTCETGFSDEFNQSLLDGFFAHKNLESTRKSHYFSGRHENIYIGRDQFPELNELLTTAEIAAAKILNEKNLKSGGWFNEMPVGHKTSSHRHDDDDELLSGVYYIHIPENSGNLILGSNENKSVIHPRAGLMVFFPPSLIHEVEENCSSETRLSFGMNFGKY